jgi:ubiquinone/menaquinone biosynthesis C-methylase UbiE
LGHATRSFDEQAGSFEQRAGLPAGVAEVVAAELVRLGALGASDVLLEIGAGTGQIGLALSRHPLCYVGFDASGAMLEVFKRRAAGRRVSLIHSDADNEWPIGDRSVKAVFSSRAIHLLRPGHVVREVFRVSVPAGAVLVLGRVQRDKDSLRSRLRQEMRRCLHELGYQAGEGRQKEHKILDACVNRGAAALQCSIAARWNVEDSAAQVLASWREKSGLAGLNLPEGVKEQTLSQLAEWARENLGSLDAAQPAEESYILESVRLPPQT